MPPLPPTSLILETLRDIALPAASGAAFTLALFLTLGRWAGTLGSAAAVIVGFVWVNFTFSALDWEGTSRLIPWKPNERSAWHYLPRASLILVVVGLASRWLGSLAGCFLPDRAWWVKNLLVWVPRWVAILVVGNWVTPLPWSDAHPWIKPALGAAMLFLWIALDGLARGGASDQATLALAATFLAAGGVIIYAHSSLFMDIALALAFAMIGIAVLARVTGCDASGAIPAGVGFLPTLVLNFRYQAEPNNVPAVCFWLVALAPIVLLPFLIPRIARQNRWLLLGSRFVFLAIPLVIAVALAMHHEDLPPFGEEE
jgi:hypothetical protein